MKNEIKKTLAEHRIKNQIRDITDPNIESIYPDNVSYSPSEEDENLSKNSVKELINNIKEKEGISKDKDLSLFEVLKGLKDTEGVDTDMFKKAFDYVVQGYNKLYPNIPENRDYDLEKFDNDLMDRGEKPTESYLSKLFNHIGTPMKTSETPQKSTENSKETNNTPEENKPVKKPLRMSNGDLVGEVISDFERDPNEEDEEEENTSIPPAQKEEELDTQEEQENSIEEEERLEAERRFENKKVKSSKSVINIGQGLLLNIYNPHTLDSIMKSQKVHHKNLFDFPFVANNLDKDGKLNLTFRPFVGTSEDKVGYKYEKRNAIYYREISYPDFLEKSRREVALKLLGDEERYSEISEEDLVKHSEFYIENVPIAGYAKDKDGNEVLVTMLNGSTYLALSNLLEDPDTGDKMPMLDDRRVDVYGANYLLRKKILANGEEGTNVKINIKYKDTYKFLKKDVKVEDEDGNTKIETVSDDKPYYNMLSEEPESAFEDGTIKIIRVDRHLIDVNRYEFTDKDSNKVNIYIEDVESKYWKDGTILIARQIGFIKDFQGNLHPHYSLSVAEHPRTDRKIHETILNIARAYALSSFNRVDLRKALEGYRDPEIIKLVDRLFPALHPQTGKEDLEYAYFDFRFHHMAETALSNIYRIAKIPFNQDGSKSLKAKVQEYRKNYYNQKIPSKELYKRAFAEYFNPETDADETKLANKVEVYFENSKIYIAIRDSEGKINLKRDDNFIIINPYTINEQIAELAKENEDFEETFDYAENYVFEHKEVSPEVILGKMYHIDQQLDVVLGHFNEVKGSSTTANIQYPDYTTSPEKHRVVFYSSSEDENGNIVNKLEDYEVEEYTKTIVPTPHFFPSVAHQDIDGNVTIGHTDHNGREFSTASGYYTLEIDLDATSEDLREKMREEYDSSTPLALSGLNIKSPKQVQKENDIEQINQAIEAQYKVPETSSNESQNESSDSSSEESTKVIPKEISEEVSKEEIDAKKQKAIELYLTALGGIEDSKFINDIKEIMFFTKTANEIKAGYLKDYGYNIEDDIKDNKNISYSPSIEIKEDKYKEN